MSLPARSLSGWHPADVKAAVAKKGWTLAALALANGFHESYLRQALIRPLFEGEQIIAKTIGVAASLIWPQRYRVTQRSDARRWAALQTDLRNAKRRAA
jgi:Ner family transcriptional regulator